MIRNEHNKNILVDTCVHKSFKWFLTWISMFLLASALSASEKYNVLLIMADDLGYECIKAYGGETYTTPNIDTLAAKGILFKNCHANPKCTPSRVRIMSGKSNVMNYKDFAIFPKEERTFGNYFHEMGFSTAIAGKWQLAASKGRGIRADAAGFDNYCLWNYPHARGNRYWDSSHIRDGEYIKAPAGSFGPDIMVNYLVNFITTHKDKPFLAYYPMMLVHGPFVPTPDSKNVKEENRNDKKKGRTDNKQMNFIDMVAYMDKCVGMLIDALEKNGLRKKTLVIFTGDNGTTQGLNSVVNGKTIPGGKGLTHDYGTHVPLVVNFPGKIPEGQVNDDLICFSDIFPTITEAAGLQMDKTIKGDGISFWPQCLGQKAKGRDYLFTYYFPNPYLEKRNKKTGQTIEARFSRDKKYKLYDTGNMYDTTKDVMETSPLNPKKDDKEAEKARVALQAVLDTYPKRSPNIDYDRVDFSKITSK